MTQTNDATTNIRNLRAGTLVVSTLDGEPGRVVRVSSTSRNGQRAWSYVALTSDGREVWDVADIFVPESVA